MKKAIFIISNIIVLWLLLIGIFLMVSFLPQSKYKVLSVMSGSMEPTISTGAVVVTWPSENIGEGDIVTFESQEGKKNEYTTHRVVRKEEKTDGYAYFTKGDANETEDTNYVSEERIIGKVAFSVKYLGYLAVYAKTLPGILVIVVISTLIIADEVKKIKNEHGRIRKTKKKKKESEVK